MWVLSCVSSSGNAEFRCHLASHSKAHPARPRTRGVPSNMLDVPRRAKRRQARAQIAAMSDKRKDGPSITPNRHASHVCGRP
jgi:hypothetical protein